MLDVLCRQEFGKLDEGQDILLVQGFLLFQIFYSYLHMELHNGLIIINSYTNISQCVERLPVFCRKVTVINCRSSSLINLPTNQRVYDDNLQLVRYYFAI